METFQGSVVTFRDRDDVVARDIAHIEQGAPGRGIVDQDEVISFRLGQDILQ